ncbi:MoxR family ATPase [Desulfococcaceae bacterium HSG7]|nr:MoxR family ATPase [Desulfococcaceae bacterium HSG7]
MAENLEYTGKTQPQKDEKDKNGQPLSPYIPSDELVEAVNLAIYLKRPLFIKGEPGCGKTKLARDVAYELKLPYYSWTIKSTSRAQDGLYNYDAVGRLHDTQLIKLIYEARLAEYQIATGSENNKPLGIPIDISPDELEKKYITYGSLGLAFRNEQRTVVLIDEIDKADIDFPNDLLLELDELRFTVKELKNKEIAANENPPIIIITSNDEDEGGLSEPFLRRCVFHYIKFPDRERLTEIMKFHFPESVEREELLDGIIGFVLELRQEMSKNPQQSRKKVSTSELLDWYKALQHNISDDNQIIKKLSEKEFLYPGVLIKNWEDYQRYVTPYRSKDRK